jgi:hypothetical protein
LQKDIEASLHLSRFPHLQANSSFEAETQRLVHVIHFTDQTRCSPRRDRHGGFAPQSGPFPPFPVNEKHRLALRVSVDNNLSDLIQKINIHFMPGFNFI